jgi:transposase
MDQARTAWAREQVVGRGLRGAARRCSFDALALATTQLLSEDPRSGALFVFVNKQSTRAKVLWWDTNGYCLLYKRLHQALFVLPSTRGDDSRGARIDGHTLAVLLAGVEKRRRGLDG